MSATMALGDFLDIFADKMTRRVQSMPEYLFRDWGAPTALETDNVVATLLALDELTVIDRRVMRGLLDPYRVPFTPLHDWSGRFTENDDTVPSISAMTFRPRNYFVRHSIDLSVLGGMGVDTSKLITVFQRNQADFLWVWYMPDDR